MYDSGNSNWIVNQFYEPQVGVGYVFISNLIASLVKFIVLLPEMNFRGGFDFSIIKEMLKYAYPMLLVGLAYVVNETLDRAMLKELLYRQYLTEIPEITSSQALIKAQSANGIYGANYKITMIVSMFIQAFRYASEPFFFRDQSNEKSKETLSKVMNYFVITLVFIFLVITLYLHLFKYFIPNESYWIGLKVVPVLLAANICLGLYTNVSMWYKLADKTIFGALISFIGVVITLSINLVFIPKYGYVASAYATLICYGTMMVVGYVLGQMYYPIPYNLKKICTYICVGFGLYYVSEKFNPSIGYDLFTNLYHGLLLVVYVVMVFIIERPKLKLKSI